MKGAYPPLAGIHRLDYRVAGWPLAEFESVEVVLVVNDLIVGAHGFAKFVASSIVKVFNPLIYVTKPDVGKTQADG